LVNAVSAKMGGAANYLKEVAGQLASRKGDDEFIFLVPPERTEAIRKLFPRAEAVESDVGSAGILARLWFDQITLPRLLRKRKVDALFSSADFGCLRAPCRQVLLIRNPTYFFAMYLKRYSGGRTLKTKLKEHLRRRLVCWSIMRADYVITPSQAMLDEVKRWVEIPDSKGFANLYGVNHAKFSTRQADERRNGPWRLLFVSLYTDHKNLITLLRAMEILAERKMDVELRTTADPNWPAARVTQSWEEDSQLAASAPLKDRVRFVMSDAASVPKNLYADCDIFVYPSVVESFGHALAEAMAAGLPIVAADVPINRELCGDSALFCSPFDPAELAAKVELLVNDPRLRKELGRKALERSQSLRWDRHVDVLLSCLRGERATRRRLPRPKEG